MKVRCSVCGYVFEVADDATQTVCPAYEAELDIPDDVEIVE